MLRVSGTDHRNRENDIHSERRLDQKEFVPQGSILGLLLFLIHNNDIVKDIDTSVRLFADDTSLYIIVDTLVNAAQKLNADLSKIHNWLVSFNPSRTESMIISKKRSIANHSLLVKNNQQIQEVKFHKHLGLVFSKDGTWHDHINSFTNKAWGRINVMRTLKFVLDRKALQIIYYTFIRPIQENIPTLSGTIVHNTRKTNWTKFS